MKTPAHLYLEVAALVDPVGDGDEITLAANRSFRAAIDHAYHAGWRDHEQKMIDRLSDIVKQTPAAPPEVHP